MSGSRIDAAMKPNAAIAYHPEGFDTSAERLMGRQAAGEGFLEGFVRHGGVASLYCYTRANAAYQDFLARARRASASAPSAQHIPESRPDLLRQPGCLFLSGPLLAPQALKRATVGAAAYSLCGVTHTLATTAVMDAIGDYLTAPLEPWDALICTSRAAKSVVDQIIEAQAAYLAERIGAKPTARLACPIIPLGVDCDRFASNASGVRAAWRARLGIGESDVAALFVGRLSYHAKANPAPMCLGLEAAIPALPQGARLHLVLAGWFANATLERGFRDAAASLCPSVNLIVVDGRDPEARAGLWHAADLFTSLSDNIQETFGLTPIEAMAAGLPSVVADWDGYRDTVAHGETGFRIPTLGPAGGTGRDLAFRYANEIDSYDRYIGGVALCTVVDVRAAGAAYRQLIGEPALRRRMGAAARDRAREHYDWRVVIAAYQALWAELGARRARAADGAATQARAARVALRDPFTLFAGFPTGRLTASHRIAWARDQSPDAVDRLLTRAVANYAPYLLLEAEACRALASTIRDGGTTEVGWLIEQQPTDRRGKVTRTLLWFAKFGLIEIEAPSPPERP